MNTFYDQLVSKLITSERFIEDGSKTISFLELLNKIENFRKIIRQKNIHTLGIFCDNGINWIVSDLACVLENITSIPLPNFFSKEQNNHIIKKAGIHFIYDGKEILETQTKETVHPFSKITFTSGSTGSPKGVCLSNENIF
jgi:long-subunit acyl-CoA synthetase (AMP-forming)